MYQIRFRAGSTPETRRAAQPGVEAVRVLRGHCRITCQGVPKQARPAHRARAPQARTTAFPRAGNLSFHAYGTAQRGHRADANTRPILGRVLSGGEWPCRCRWQRGRLNRALRSRRQPRAGTQSPRCGGGLGRAPRFDRRVNPPKRGFTRWANCGQRPRRRAAAGDRPDRRAHDTGAAAARTRGDSASCGRPRT